MTKRTAVCGVPMYVVRKIFIPMLAMNIVWVTLNSVLWEFIAGYLVDITAKKPIYFLILLFVTIGLVPTASLIWFMYRADRYTRRMKRLKGRGCFVCNYEIAEGLERCSECGAVWSLSDLNRKWRRNVGGE